MKMTPDFESLFAVASGSHDTSDPNAKKMMQDISDFIKSDNVIFAAEGAFPDLNEEVTEQVLVLWGWRATPHETQFLEQYRKSAPNAAVLVVSASNDSAARAKAFELGADNYCPPDASLVELTAKANRLMSRVNHNGLSETPLTFGGISIWPKSRIALRNGNRISLSRLEFAVLACLAEKSPAPVSRAELEQAAFHLNHDPGTNIVAVHIHRLRKKVEQDGSLIQTVQGKGYCLMSVEQINSDETKKVG